MRVLILAKDFPSAVDPSAGIFVLRQAQALAALGHDVLAVRFVPHAPPGRPKWRRYRSIPAEEVVEGIAVKTVRAVFLPRMWGMEFVPQQVARPIARIVSAFRPDVVHAHFLLPAGQVAVRQRLPVVVTAHGSDAYEWAWQRPGLQRASVEAIAKADRVVAVSDYIRRRVRALHERDVDVAFNGADEKIFAPGDRARNRRRAGIGLDRFVIAFAGRPTKAKGAFDLVEAAARLRDVRPLLLVAGPLEGADELRARAESAGVEARLSGTVSHAQLAAQFAASNVFALPSHHEGLPASVCEAMLCGRPVVASAVGGIPEILADARHGYLTAPGDVQTLADRLRSLALDPVLAERLGAAAHDYARRELTWTVNARQYERFYRSAAARER